MHFKPIRFPLTLNSADRCEFISALQAKYHPEVKRPPSTRPYIVHLVKLFDQGELTFLSSSFTSQFDTIGQSPKHVATQLKEEIVSMKKSIKTGLYPNGWRGKHAPLHKGNPSFAWNELDKVFAYLMLIS